MEKINVAELLKDCPKGMKLDCVMFEDVEFNCVTEGDYPIRLIIKDDTMKDTPLSLTKEGCYNTAHNPKCVIFPKGKTSWEGFQRPFVDGDIVATNSGNWIGIMEKEEHDGKVMSVYCVLKGSAGLEIYHEKKGKWCFSRLATEEEKQRLFDAMEKKGYKWNPIKKCLEPLVIKPKFKIGDEIKFSCRGSIFIVTAVNDKYYCLVEKGSTITFPALISSDKDWELVPNKFDITNLKHHNEVLVRNTYDDHWKCDFFSHYRNNTSSTQKFSCTGGNHRMCIPYEGNAHLRGTTNDCSDYYKNWD